MLSAVSRRGLCNAARPLSVGLLGLPMSKGQKKAGTELAPAELRKRGLIESLEATIQGPMHDFGDVDFRPCGEYDGARYMAASARLIRQTVAKCLDECQRLVTLGGDHSVAMGTVAGHADHARANGRELAVIWIDAHSDINTPKTSPSGSWHGMPVAMCLHEMMALMPPMKEFEGWVTPLDAASIAYIGLRDVDSSERYFLDKLRIVNFTMRDLDAYGINKVAEMALDKVDPHGHRSIHVSFDVDGLDPSVAPSTGTPVAAGMTLREAAVVCETIAASERLSVLDLVEINPLIGTPADVTTTMETATQVARWLFGQRQAGGHVPADSPRL